MSNFENVDAKTQGIEDQSETPKVEIQSEGFPTTKPKFTKEDWDSGEGSGQGEG